MVEERKQKFNYKIKIILLGDSNVGKSSIADRFTKDRF